MSWYDEAFPKDSDRPGCWLRWLAETDEVEAQLYQDKENMANEIKAKKATVIEHLQGEPGNMDEKRAQAENHQSVKQAIVAHLEAEFEWRRLHNQRKTVDTTIEAWRTREASRRATAKGI